MDIIEVDNYHSLLKRHIPIGVGTTAYCFLMPDNKVFKLFKKNYRENSIFRNNEIIERLEDINKIQNDTYIGPESIVMQDDKVIGYIYPLIEGKTFNKVNMNTKVIDILNNMDKLIEDTKDISNKGFYLVDMHDRNLIYNGSYYVIDLDKGHLAENYPHLYRLNMKRIYDTIFFRIFGLRPWDGLQFNNPNLDRLYFQTKWDDRDAAYNTYEEFTKVIGVKEPTVKELRRIPHRKVHDEYRSLFDM